jgi:hypothetical protein
MLVAPSRDWNVFKQIFAEHWDGFTYAHPRYQTAYYHGLVAKMLDCGNPDKMGSIEYRCLAVAQKSPCEGNRVIMGKESPLKLGQRGQDAREEMPMRTPKQ